MYCDNCSNRLVRNAQFCPHCGMRIKQRRPASKQRSTSQQRYSNESYGKAGSRVRNPIGRVIKIIIMLFFVAAVGLFLFAIFSDNSSGTGIDSGFFADKIQDVKQNLIGEGKEGEEGEDMSSAENTANSSSKSGLSGQEFVNYFNSKTSSSIRLNEAKAGKNISTKIFSGISVGVATNDDASLSEIGVSSSLISLRTSDAQANVQETLVNIFKFMTPNESVNPSDFGINNISDILGGTDITKSFGNVSYRLKVSGLKFSFTARVS